jgi:mRNA interferase RelE/StbE
MNHQIQILRRAQKALSDLPAGDYERVRDAIASLKLNPRPIGCKKLVGRDGWRIREGDYRVIYTIDDELQEVLVLDVGNRRDIYR